MITLSAQITLHNTDTQPTTYGLGENLVRSGDFTSAVITNSKNNISANIDEVLGKRSDGGRPFLLGVSKLDGKSRFSSGEDYYIGNVVASNNNLFPIPYTITVYGYGITSMTIVFDSYNNRRPVNAVNIDNGPVIVSSPIVTISGLDGSEAYHTIDVRTWNTPNYPLVIEGIYSDIVSDITYSRLTKLDYKIESRGDIGLPSYGIISNRGNISFVDIDDEYLLYAESGLLKFGADVDVILTDTLSKKSEVQASAITSEWSYDNDNKQISATLKDNLEEWQNITIEGINFDPRNPNMVLTNGTMADLYVWLQKPENTPSKYNMLTFEELDERTKEILTKTEIDYPVLKSDTLWNQWTKLCNVCALYIYRNKFNRVTCSYFYGA